MYLNALATISGLCAPPFLEYFSLKGHLIVKINVKLIPENIIEGSASNSVPRRWRVGLMRPAVAMFAALSVVVMAGCATGESSDGSPAATTAAEGSTSADADSGEEASNDSIPTSQGGSREDPAPLGEGFVFELSTFGDADESVWEATVTGPGRDITAEVMEENMFNDPPVDGNIFFGIPFRLILAEAGKVPLAPIFNLSWDVFGPASLKIYGSLDARCGVMPDEFESSTEVFIGGGIEGMLCFSLPQEDVDAGPLLSAEPAGDRIYLETSGEIGAVGPSVYAGAALVPDGSGDLGEITNPSPVGADISFTVSSFGDADGSVWSALVTGLGRDITAEVMEENMFNEPAAQGHIFYGIPFELTLAEASKEPLAPLFNISWDLFGPSSLKIFSGLYASCGVVPDVVDTMTEVFVGGSLSGLLCFSIPQADADAGPLLSTDQGSVRLYLATK